MNDILCVGWWDLISLCAIRDSEAKDSADVMQNVTANQVKCLFFYSLDPKKAEKRRNHKKITKMAANTPSKCLDFNQISAMEDDDTLESYAPLLAPFAKQLDSLNRGVERDELHFVRVCSEVDTNTDDSNSYLAALEVRRGARARKIHILTARSAVLPRTTDARLSNSLNRHTFNKFAIIMLRWKRNDAFSNRW